jgi:magnesium transporter
LRISDLSESYRDLVSSLFDIHFSVVANKTNDIVKFLTIFSAIWLPLSFIAGVYGMNFDNIPELHTTYGYFMTLGLMVVIALGLIGYFWYKGWIFKRETVPEETSPDAEIHTTRINE